MDATVIGASSSTKNADMQRHSQIHQTRKGQQWFFEMKMHTGVDSQPGLAHSAVVTAAKVQHDKHPLPELLNGWKIQVYGDCAYSTRKTQHVQAAPRTSPAAPCCAG